MVCLCDYLMEFCFFNLNTYIKSGYGKDSSINNHGVSFIADSILTKPEVYSSEGKTNNSVLAYIADKNVLSVILPVI